MNLRANSLSMSRRRFLRMLPPLALLLALSGCGGGSDSGTTSSSDIGTLAYVTTECRDTAEGFLEHQTLHILHGDRDVTVMETPGVGPVTGVGMRCRAFSLERYGDDSITRGAFQGVAVSADGAMVVFEISDDFSTNPPLPLHLPPEQKGIFLVRADGSDLRPLGLPSRVPFFRFDNSGTLFPQGSFGFSPDGRLITFADMGPDATGSAAGQVFTLDVGSGLRRQVTHLPPAIPPADRPLDSPSVEHPVFVDTQTIGFYTFANPDGLNLKGAVVALTVRSDGSKEPEAAPLPVTVPDSQIVSTFVITGDKPAALTLRLPVQAKNGRPGDQVLEIFAIDGSNLLQLTNFQRVDTFDPTLGVDRQTVFFDASADPFGTNPSETCQIFSVDRLGSHLRQLTQLSAVPHATNGCFFSGPPGCAAGMIGQDSRTGVLIFYSSCDPLGTNPHGEQVFAMHPDGSDLRQLTHTQGLVIHPGVEVIGELPGPIAYGPYAL